MTARGPAEEHWGCREDGAWYIPELPPVPQQGHGAIRMGLQPRGENLAVFASRAVKAKQEHVCQGIEAEPCRVMGKHQSLGLAG